MFITFLLRLLILGVIVSQFILDKVPAAAASDKECEGIVSKGSSLSLHSAEYFGEQRDYWWNLDFLHLMGQRWGVEKVRSVLDVGCGVGHWGMLLNNVLPEAATVVGIDRESVWVEEAQARAKSAKLDDRYTYQEGDADMIPFPDESFDMVTCQTLLIHVADIRRTVNEMCRVLKHGGILVVIEPNNLARSLCLNTLNVDDPVEDILDIARLQLICERGKKALNEGYNSIGDQLPACLSSLGLEDIQVFISDKATTFVPPYESGAQRSLIDQACKWSGKNFWIWSEVDTRRYYEAGGGDMERFSFYWTKALRENERFLDGIKAGSYSMAGGNLNYCISARKP